MTLTQKVTRAAAAADTAKEFLQYYHKSVVNGKEVEEDDATLDSKKRKRYIADWIGRHLKTPPSNEDEEAEVEEEDVGATQSSTEDNSPIEEYEEGCEYDREYDREDTVLLDATNTKEEASSRHEGESPSSDLSERSDENDDDDDGIGAK